MDLEDDILERKSLADLAYQNIKKYILSFKMKGGERIDEEKLAKIFGVSRTPIREALKRLQNYGLVKIYPHKYAEVVKLDEKDRQYIREVRIPLDSTAIRLLAPKATEEDYMKLRKYAELCQEAVDREDIASCFENDSAFHLEIALRTGNPYFYKICKDFDVKVQLLRATFYHNLDEIRKGISHHLPVAEAIRNHDVDKAVQLMTEHLNMFYNIVL